MLGIERWPRTPDRKGWAQKVEFQSQSQKAELISPQLSESKSRDQDGTVKVPELGC